MAQKKKISKVKSSVFSRGLSLARLGLNAGLQYASNRITNSPLEEFLNSQAATLTKEFGELKGSVMKAGQMLSMYGEHFLPAEANAMLKTLQSDSAPVEWGALRGHLETYLDESLLDELEINPESIGTASMGQVHLAVVKATGEKLALKIQYPGLEKAIDSDVAALKKLLSLAKVLPAGLDLSGVFEEIKVMLRQELDYTQEAAHTRRYRELVGPDSRYVVPRVFERYSNRRVLATEYLEGLKADHPLVQSLSQARRNRLSENFLELYFREIFQWDFAQSDPHLGNYKVQIDSSGQDRLVLLDFGACKEFKKSFIGSYRKMVKGAVLKNDALLTEGARGLEFIVATDKPDYIAAFKEFCAQAVEPFQDGMYNWKANDLPQRVFKNALRFKNFDLRAPPRDILFLDRKTGGVFIFLSVLGAEINARKIIAPFLDQV